MKKRLFALILLFASALTGIAQTAADSLAIVSAEWQVTQLQQGLVAKKAVFKSLYGVPQEISIFEVSPKKFWLKLQNHKGMERTSEVSTAHGAVAAINGTFYNMKKGFSESYLQLEGEVIDTTVIGITQSNGAVCIKNGKVKIVSWSKIKEREVRNKPKKLSIMASGPLMLQDGTACDLSELHRKFVETKHPRSGIAVTKDKKVLLIVVDGRRKGKCEGVSIAEFTHLVRILGASDALNLDGGGSSTLWSAYLPEDGILNTPSDKSGERKVANSIGVYLR